MLVSFEPTRVVDTALESLPITLVAIVALWVVVREFGPAWRLRRQLLSSRL